MERTASALVDVVVERVVGAVVRSSAEHSAVTDDGVVANVVGGLLVVVALTRWSLVTEIGGGSRNGVVGVDVGRRAGLLPATLGAEATCLARRPLPLDRS